MPKRARYVVDCHVVTSFVVDTKLHKTVAQVMDRAFADDIVDVLNAKGVLRRDGWNAFRSLTDWVMPSLLR